MIKRVKLRFPYTSTTGEDEIEVMWTIEKEHGYELDNIPFYVKNLALGDVVSAEMDSDGALWFSELVQPSGHSTIRLWFAGMDSITMIRDELNRMGCASEVSDLPRLVAVDVPPSIPYEKVKELFDQGERVGTFEYQEACLGFSPTTP